MTPDLPYAADRDIPLGIPGFRYADLYRPERLQALLARFDAEAQVADPALFDAFARYRADPGKLPPPEISDLLMRMAPQVARFVARLFQVEPDLRRQRREAEALHPLFLFKRRFVANRADRGFKPSDLATLDAESLDTDRRALLAAAFRENPSEDPERDTARMVLDLLDLEAAPEAGACAALRGKIMIHREARTRFGEALRGDDKDLVSVLLQRLEAWAFAFPRDEATRHKAHAWVTLRHPRTLDFEHLVKLEHPQADLPGMVEGPAAHRRRRDGFQLTDPRMAPTEVAAEVDYCLYCHERERDSCSTGLREKEGALRKNPLGITLSGCPLDQRISEAHALEKDGEPLAALAVILVDNPMVPGTGHRICNDCMKACIFQKQEPVNIPQIETGILGRVLRMPYGVEIYGLLTRWNPLNVRQPCALPHNGKTVLVVGLGPAGYTLSHYLLNEGFGVAGIDGLKIEPPRADLAGADAWPPKPVRDFAELEERLDERILAGFGGVAEYGITARWDKNFLGLIHLILVRRSAFRIYGGVRFGGTVTIEDAWAWGFDHIAIAAGAGRPTVIELKNNLIRGIRKASDFLMALQLTGAAKKRALANLQLRLPVVVVGGGLTAIDTATEAMAYYPAQVEKTLDRFETLAKNLGEDRVLALYDAEEREILEEFLEHGRAVRDERTRAKAAGEAPDLAALVRRWGGSTIAYRKKLTDAPAYRLNHEEIEKALEEGIRFAGNLVPVEAVPDRFGALEAVGFKGADGKELRLPARSLLIAAGTSPNTIYEKERPGTFALDARKQFFRAHKIVGGKAVPAAHGETGFFTSCQKDGRFISYYGDTHPRYAGNVVRAMASARDGYPEVVALFAEALKGLDPARQGERDAALAGRFRTLDDLLVPTVHAVSRLTPTIVELVVRAPMAARRFEPGQFFRLQNYERLAPVVDGHRLAMEGIALTGAWVDRENGLLGLILLEMGASSRLCAYLRPGERVVVMGPTGSPTEIPENETVLLLGGGLGNAVLFSIAKAMRERRNRVLYFAAYKKASDIFKMDEVEEATDQVIWSVDQGKPIAPRRSQDRSFRGNVVQAMVAYAKGELGKVAYPLDTVSRLIAIGSDRMMAAVKQSRKTVLAPYLKPDHIAIASLNSPMQCMMKEVCAQCLQKHVDPATGAETGAVFSCFNQDQPMDSVDFPNLNARLRQNTVQEKLTNLWLNHLLARPGAPKAQVVPA